MKKTFGSGKPRGSIDALITPNAPAREVLEFSGYPDQLKSSTASAQDNAHVPLREILERFSCPMEQPVFDDARHDRGHHCEKGLEYDTVLSSSLSPLSMLMEKQLTSPADATEASDTPTREFTPIPQREAHASDMQVSFLGGQLCMEQGACLAI